MKKWIFPLAILLSMTNGVVGALETQTAASVFGSVRWYGQNSLRLEMAGKVIWIDPAYGPTTEKADVILVTHPHADHFAPSRMKKLTGPKTTVLVGFTDFTYPRLPVGESRTVGDLTITAVPMYDLFETPHHEKVSGFCGYLLSAGGVTVYIAGDAGLMPEMASIHCDVAFLPLGQTFTFRTVDEAVQAAVLVGAKYVAPVHFGLYEGTADDAQTFVRALTARGVTAKILDKL